jgi:hypothetical protein
LKNLLRATLLGLGASVITILLLRNERVFKAMQEREYLVWSAQYTADMDAEEATMDDAFDQLYVHLGMPQHAKNPTAAAFNIAMRHQKAGAET